MKATGRLNCDQFALAMHLVQQKIIHGIEPPLQLSSDMIPPSLQVGQF
jgi:epidermal growth factor receptor substrate 15